MTRAATQTRSTAACGGGTGRGKGWIDRGERYRVTFRDGMGTRRIFGYTNDEAEARQFCAKVYSNPMWTDARISDRGVA